MYKQDPHNITFRLPKNKEHLKTEIVKASGEMGLSLTMLMTFIIEDFLRRREAGERLRVDL